MLLNFRDFRNMEIFMGKKLNETLDERYGSLISSLRQTFDFPMGTPYFSHNHALLLPIVVHRVSLDRELEMFYYYYYFKS